MTGPKFEHAGTSEPVPLAVASSSELSPHGSTGLVNQGVRETVEQVGPIYSDLAQATELAALSKRDADQAVLDK